MNIVFIAVISILIFTVLLLAVGLCYYRKEIYKCRCSIVQLMQEKDDMLQFLSPEVKAQIYFRQFTNNEKKSAIIVFRKVLSDVYKSIDKF